MILQANGETVNIEKVHDASVLGWLEAARESVHQIMRQTNERSIELLALDAEYKIQKAIREMQHGKQ